ncbi:hypothetical protein [Bacillus wiedmannii]|uniref:deoxynucleotide monophosphate kinase family protein n=1 Tax=Bacillus wiedmannii TaxID=1890302 RepID=UPI000BF06A5D|nr:hypothetical protein [Bacillus wiedmannii]PEM08530.1 hypothetical protein CN610_19965 [Bacillus wiedmannii]
MTIKKIALVGQIRSGKDSVGKMIMEREGHKQFTFAAGIRRIGRDYFPELYANPDEKPRELEQFIGQEFRKFDPDVWIKDLKTSLDLEEFMTFSFEEFKPIVTDMRQENEYHALKALGFTVIKVEADYEIRKQRAIAAGDVFKEEMFNHETELAATACPYDHLITNNGTLEELTEKVESLLKSLKEVS